MSRPDYQIRVTDPQTGLVTLVLPLVESFALKYEVALNKITSFALTVPFEARYYDIFRLDAIVDVMRTDPSGAFQTEATFLTRMTDQLEAEGDERFVATGFHANHLLKRRFIDPADDSVQPNGGYATKAGTGGSVIRAYIREQAGDLASANRQTFGLVTPVELNDGGNTGGNFRYENLWDELVKMGDVSNIQIHIEHNGARSFTCTVGTIGTDRSLNTVTDPVVSLMVFDPVRGNIQSPQLTVDRRNEVTYVRTRGSGARDNRISIPLSSPRINDSLYNRIESTSDARGVDDTDALGIYLEGLKFLNEKRPETTFEFQPLVNTGGAIYRRNFYFGDTVTAQWGEFVDTLRVNSLTFEVQDEDETLEIGLQNEQ